MPLTDAELQGIAAQALNIAKRDIERGSFNFLLASYHVGDQPPLHRMTMVEALIIGRLGKDWLNHGRTKDAGFLVLRRAVDIKPPDAVIFVSMCNSFLPTAKLRALTLAAQAELANRGHDAHHQAVADGLLEVCDVLAATVQSPERVCLYQQPLDGRGNFTGQPEARCMPQEGFGGRFKMFGSEHAISQ